MLTLAPGSSASHYYLRGLQSLHDDWLTYPLPFVSCFVLQASLAHICSSSPNMSRWRSCRIQLLSLVAFQFCRLLLRVLGLTHAVSARRLPLERQHRRQSKIAEQLRTFSCLYMMRQYVRYLVTNGSSDLIVRLGGCKQSATAHHQATRTDRYIGVVCRTSVNNLGKRARAGIYQPRRTRQTILTKVIQYEQCPL